MTDAVLNSKRRLERHSRRDSSLQSRARPVMNERADEDASFVRSFVKKAQEGGQEFGKRLGPGFFGSSDPTGSRGGNDGSSGGSDSTRSSDSSTGGGRGSSGASATGRPGGFESTTRESSSTRESSDPLGLGNLSPTSRSSSTTESSTRTTSSSSTSTSSRSTTPAILTTSVSTPSTTAAPTTSFAYVTSTPTTPSVSEASVTSTPEPSSSGPGAGPIIGIVAGSLAGIAVIAVIVGFLFKKLGRKEDPYEADPFERDDFRRQSAMLPDTFESDDGHPSMSEHNNLHGSGGPFSDAAYAGAGVAAAGGMAATSSFTSHNESGGPRPPTMFQKHINGPGAQYSLSEAPGVPQVGAIYNHHNDMMPQLPPMTFGGSDPYSIAGVGRSNMESNMNNPYAHLDRSVGSPHAQAPQERYEAPDSYANLNRNGSNGSYSQDQSEQYRSGNDYDSSAHGYNTAGRPGTAEGRSGTPDLPNVQQTYALGDGGEEDRHQEMERVASPHRMMASPQHMSQDMYSQYGQANSPFQDGGSPTQQPLQVRNLLPNPHEAQHRQQAQRPISSASSQPADDDAAYGGVW